MPAHLRSIRTRCFWSGCSKDAELALYNAWNSHVGVYCSEHGQAALKEQRAADDKIIGTAR